MDEKLKPINARQAEKLTKKLGLCFGGDGRTYYATNDDESEIWEFDTKAARDNACK